MLMMFNLNWEYFDIDAKVSQASRNLNSLVKSMGAEHRIQFDLTSLGAGEVVFPERSGDKKLPQKTLDFLREKHAEVRGELGKDSTFNAYKEMATALRSLHGDRHKLVAVHEGEKDECIEQLERARLLRYFGDEVYGYDDLRKGERSITHLYNKVMRETPVHPQEAVIKNNHAGETFIIDETEIGMYASRALEVTGLAYISAQNCADAEVADRAVRMQDAGAVAVASTPMDLRVLPYQLCGKPPELNQKKTYEQAASVLLFKRPQP